MTDETIPVFVIRMNVQDNPFWQRLKFAWKILWAKEDMRLEMDEVLTESYIRAAEAWLEKIEA